MDGRVWREEMQRHLSLSTKLRRVRIIAPLSHMAKLIEFVECTS